MFKKVILRQFFSFNIGNPYSSVVVQLTTTTSNDYQITSFKTDKFDKYAQESFLTCHNPVVSCCILQSHHILLHCVWIMYPRYHNDIGVDQTDFCVSLHLHAEQRYLSFCKGKKIYVCLKYSIPRYEATTLTKLIPVTLVVMLTFSARGTKNRFAWLARVTVAILLASTATKVLQ